MAMTPMLTFATQFGTRSDTRAEADVHSAIAAFLTVAQLGLDEQHVVKLEDVLQDGTRRRIDVSYGRLLIEVKRDLSTPNVRAKAEEQLAGYLRAKHEDTGDVYAGIISDGVVWRLYALHADGLAEADEFVLARIDHDSIERLQVWLHAILLTGPRLLATKRRIEERLGADSPRYKFDRARLEKLYQENCHDPALVLKKDLWSRLLKTALGTSFTEDDSLFIDHTMLVIEAEIIAHLVVGLDPSVLTPKQVLSGSQFHAAGITNVVESDFFDWPAEVPGGDELVMDLVREISHLDWSSVEHDLLKTLYEAIIGADVRKALGEYYTEDWLARRIVEDQVDLPLTQRVADVSCGSGTFLFHAVRRFLAAADEEGLENEDAIALLQDRVFGMDIHPVSVVLARVTYLLAIGTEKLKRRRALTVPVYLGDSVQWGRAQDVLAEGVIRVPVDAEDLASVDTESYQALVSVGKDLCIPSSAIAEPAALDSLIGALAARAQTFVDAGQNYPGLSDLWAQHDVGNPGDRLVLEETFHTLCDLNAAGRDHIWGYYLRNQIRPIWMSLPERQMDRLVGNPPWLSYRYMSPGMKAQFRRMSMSRGLWAGGAVATNMDLVGLFVARTVEQFLKVGGKFGLVTPWGVLSRRQYTGLRTGEWLNRGDTKVTARFSAGWDLSAISDLFPQAAAVIFGEKSQDAPVPMPSGHLKVTSRQADSPLMHVEVPQIVFGDALKSPYGGLVHEGATITPWVLFVVEKVEASPLGQPIGQTEVRSKRSSQEKGKWKLLPVVQTSIEKKFVHPLLLGRSLVPFRTAWPEWAVLPIADGRLLGPAERASHPLLAQRWAEIEAIWNSNRSNDKMSLDQRIDFRKGLREQFPAPKHRVLYTGSGKRISAVVCSDPDAVVEHKLYWVEVQSEQEADYLAAVLNTDAIMTRVAPYQSKGVGGTRDIDTLPFRFPIARFDEDDDVHVEIAGLGADARKVAADTDLSGVTDFVVGRARVRTALQAAGVLEPLEVAVEAALEAEAVRLLAVQS